MCSLAYMQGSVKLRVRPSHPRLDVSFDISRFPQPSTSRQNSREVEDRSRHLWPLKRVRHAIAEELEAENARIRGRAIVHGYCISW